MTRYIVIHRLLSSQKVDIWSLGVLLMRLLPLAPGASLPR